MLEEYVNLQPIASKIIINQIKNNSISHAYIIETNGYYKGFDYTKAIVKSMMCPHKNISLTNCGHCTQCARIDDNNYTELEIIEPDGLWIKKEQLNNLQKNFSSKSIEGSRKVYIINHAEQLNDSAANSILKFIEEPEDGIIAFLIVESSSSLNETIVSRCQKIKLINNNVQGKNTVDNVCYYMFNSVEEMEHFKYANNDTDIIKKTIDFIKNYEESGHEMILYENKFCALFLKDRNLFEMFLNIIILFYKDVLNYKLYNEAKIFIDDDQKVKNVAVSNDVYSVSRKIESIISIYNRFKNNCNINLMLDKLIILLEGD